MFGYARAPLVLIDCLPGSARFPFIDRAYDHPCLVPKIVLSQELRHVETARRCLWNSADASFRESGTPGLNSAIAMGIRFSYAIIFGLKE